MADINKKFRFRKFKVYIKGNGGQLKISGGNISASPMKVTGAGIFKMQRVRPIVAKMELPSGVERKMFARRFGGGRRGEP